MRVLTVTLFLARPLRGRFARPRGLLLAPRKLRAAAMVAVLAAAASVAPGCADPPAGTGGTVAGTASTAAGGAGGATAPGTSAAVEEARRRAEAAATKLAGALQEELHAALVAGPPEHAVAVCGEAAARVASEIAAAEPTLRVGRTALRLRNPKNAPDDLERRVMESWTAPGAAPRPHFEVASGELRYLRPIQLLPLCVTCHGSAEEVPGAVKEALAARYPADAATGFSPGDLRGAITVRVALGAP